MDISKLTKEQLERIINRILEQGLDYVIRGKWLYVFRFNAG